MNFQLLALGYDATYIVIEPIRRAEDSVFIGRNEETCTDPCPPENPYLTATSD